MSNIDFRKVPDIPQSLDRTARPSAAGSHIVILCAAVLAVSMAYGVTLPVLPFIVERLMGANAAAIAWHTGALTGLYTFALFVFSALWGALSDRIGRRCVMAIGLFGSAVTLLWLDSASSLGMLYAARGFSGVLSAAVLPAVLAWVAEFSQPQERPHRFALIASATTTGFLLGPAIGSWLASMVLKPLPEMRLAGILMTDSPFAMVALINLAAATSLLLLPALAASRTPDTSAGGESLPLDRSRIRLGLLLTCIAVFGITAAEVGITLLGKQVLSLSPDGIARFFLICGIAMIAVQIGIFPACAQRVPLSRLLAASMAITAVGLTMIPYVSVVARVRLAFAFVSIGTGMMIPALTTMISAAAGPAQGKTMGQQASAANFGQALGAASTGALFLLTPAAPFLIGAATAACGFLLARRLRRAE